jgi:hypothetical protein
VRASDVKQRILFASPVYGDRRAIQSRANRLSCCGATLCDSPPANKGKRNAGRRGPYHPHQMGAGRATEGAACAAPSALGRARLPGVPPRVFPRGVWSLGATRARFRGQTVQGAGVTPPTDLPTSSDAPRMPVVMPADMMPGPPGSEADEASPAGTALAPAARHHPDGVPEGEMIRQCVSIPVTIVNMQLQKKRHSSATPSGPLVLQPDRMISH